jgi:transposase
MNGPEFHWIGIDVAKSTFDAAIVFFGQRFPETAMRDVPVKTFKRTPEGADDFLCWMDTEVSRTASKTTAARAVMESTGSYSVELCMWLIGKRESLSPAIVNPQRTAYFIKSLGLRNKTDRLDACALAFYGVERRPAPYAPPSKEHHKLQELNRYRDFLVAERVSMVNRGDALSTNKGISQIAKRRLKQMESDIAKVEKEMRKIISENNQLKHDRTLLESIPGVGFLSVCTVMAELGDLRRFERDRQLAAFTGLNPSLKDSGTSVHARPRLSKSGNARIRQALYLAAMTSIRIEGPLQETYLRLIARGKSPMAALCAVMRKLLLLMRTLLLANVCYEKNHLRREAPCG